VDIHFIHVPFSARERVALIITHGWPGSVFEQIKLIGPLTDPTKYGGRAEDAFEVVIPSLPVSAPRSARPTRVGGSTHRQSVGHPHEAAGVHALRRATSRYANPTRQDGQQTTRTFGTGAIESDALA
jgi:hypothetical protein